MKSIILCCVLLILGTVANAQSLSLPVRLPVHCSASAGCAYPYIPSDGPKLGVLVSRISGPGDITDTLGNTWSKAICTGPNTDCVYYQNFNTTTNPGDTIIFPTTTGFYDVFLLLYKGNWTFDTGQWSTYDTNTTGLLPDCPSGSHCTYSWTMPIEAESGELLISWADANTYGVLIPSPGPGWYLEANNGNGNLVIQDMLAPVQGVYIGSLTWNDSTGHHPEGPGGTAWVMGVASFKLTGN